MIIAFHPDTRHYITHLDVASAGTLTLDLTSPRPLRIWLAGHLVLDEPLSWRSFEREIRAAILFPVTPGQLKMRVEIGDRPRHPECIDRDCPSRNRQRCLDGVAKRLPDQLTLTPTCQPGRHAPALALRFPATQFVRDGITWQHVLTRPVRGVGQPPTTNLRTAAEEPLPALALRSTVQPRHATEDTADDERAAGLRKFYVPVAAPGDEPAPVRGGDVDARIEPYREIARTIELTVEGSTGSVTVPLPAFESLGKLAPRREYQTIVWPAADALRAGVPEPILPETWRRFEKTYYAAWEMLRQLTRQPNPFSGLPNSYVGTGTNFSNFQFMWDTSFAALCTAYGWRVFDPYASLNVLYARQFDGGYIHREHDVRDGAPALYEPDFSPNPPIMSIAEWQIARLTGNLQRLRQVYPALCGFHRWLQLNRQLPDGTFWTTGLANGLDNSPSLGDGYPDLTAQMAHDAEILGQIAAALGRPADAAEYCREHAAIGRALNDRLWSEAQQIYSTSLPGGGHNPNKVVTAFWPLWAGIVPSDRVAALSRHLKDPASFWRHHPLPSLAADSSHFVAGGAYWLGSTWSPTNYAAIKGFDRAGRHDLAVETTVRHLECVTDVLDSTGKLWENYCSEASTPGSQSAPTYCWSALGPIALLLEVLLGLEVDALHDTVRWNPPVGQAAGIRKLALGETTISLSHRNGLIEVETDRSFTLEVRNRRYPCPIGRSNHRSPEN